MRSALAVKPFKRLFDLLRLDRREILYIYLFALVGGTITLTLPLGIQAIINLISGGQLATSWGVLIAFVTVGVAFTGAMQVMQTQRWREHPTAPLRPQCALEFAYRLPRIHPEQLRALPAGTGEPLLRYVHPLQKGLEQVAARHPAEPCCRSSSVLILLAIYHPFFIAFGISLIAAASRSSSASPEGGIGHQPGGKHLQVHQVAYWLEELGRAVSTFKLAGETTDLPLTAPTSWWNTTWVRAASTSRCPARSLLGHGGVQGHRHLGPAASWAAFW
jgi:hypothetical protein